MTTGVASAGERHAQMDTRQQFDRWQQKWNVINEVVTNAFETIRDSGDTFDKEDLYPLYPLVAASICNSLLGFTPEKLVESKVLTEELFSALPGNSNIATREMAGAGSRS